MQDHFGPARELIARTSHRVGVLARALDAPQRAGEDHTLFAHEPDRAFPSASVIKVPIAMALYADAADGRVDLGAQVATGERVEGSGVLRDLRDAQTLSLRDLAALMMVLSDNTATNRVIENLGMERVTARMAEWGISTTALRRRMFDFDAAERGLENVATARELVDLLARLVAGECRDRATSDTVLALMERCEDDRKLRRFLAPNTKVPSKSGTLDASLNDVAVFRGPAAAVAVAAFTSEVTDKRAAEHLLGVIGRCAATAAGMTVLAPAYGD
jgi:beta-lactamase class A